MDHRGDMDGGRMFVHHSLDGERGEASSAVQRDHCGVSMQSGRACKQIFGGSGLCDHLSASGGSAVLRLWVDWKDHLFEIDEERRWQWACREDEPKQWRDNDQGAKEKGT